MNAVNFIPPRRRLRAQARRRLRAWVVALPVYALVIVLGCALALAVRAGGDLRPPADDEALATEIEQIRRSVASVRKQLTEARAQSDALRTITGQADWSILLSLLGETVGEDVVLSGCRLEPLAPTAGRPRPIDPPGYTVYLDGEGPSQAAVSQFVLRLERIGLFSRVVLLKTRREARDAGPADGGGEAIAFSIEATLAPRAREGGGAP